jgi:hypothetical protein
MKQLAALACALALSVPAWAADHGPVFGYATPVNSQGEFSFDTGLFGRKGPRGTQFSARAFDSPFRSGPALSLRQAR